ncbi:hypothetical protein Tco_1094327 [Tanacetum coccineum]|uniref:Uncharacterized protein n=1 Tax=Tanacetum coccineum TaxID=301880 RepID=A0ABQ5IGM6_9ASTR
MINMDKSHSLSIPIAVRSLDVEKYPFRHSKDDEDILGPEQDIAHVPRGGIGMRSSKYFDIFKMQDIGLTLIESVLKSLVGLKTVMYFPQHEWSSLLLSTLIGSSHHSLISDEVITVLNK